MDEEDASLHQLRDWKTEFENFSLTARDDDGIRIQSLVASQTVGPRGPILLSDSNLLKFLENMTRKNIPQRCLRPRGTGAHGYFEVTKDITQICGADIFKKIGQKTDIFVRFGNSGLVHSSPDGERGSYSASIKHYTKEGNWDLVCIQFPIFTIDDPSLFIMEVQSLFNPISGLPSETGRWDFFLNRPECANFLIHLYSKEGIPSSYRSMNLYPISIFKMVNSSGDYKYVRFIIECQPERTYLTDEEAFIKRSMDRDFMITDLYNSIANGEYPNWIVKIQMMDSNEINVYKEKYKWNPFDNTKIWDVNKYPLYEIGKYVLNRNVNNQFNEVEQSAFNPGNMIPGIETSLQDRLLQGRIFAYRDAQLYRVGANVSQLPINFPKGLEYKLRTYSRDGPMNYDTVQGGAPNYFPNSFSGPKVQPILQSKQENISGIIGRYDHGFEDNFTQAITYYETIMDANEKLQIAGNIARVIKNVSKNMQNRIIKFFGNISHELSNNIRRELDNMEK